MRGAWIRGPCLFSFCEDASVNKVSNSSTAESEGDARDAAPNPTTRDRVAKERVRAFILEVHSEELRLPGQEASHNHTQYSGDQWDNRSVVQHQDCALNIETMVLDVNSYDTDNILIEHNESFL